jgi:hypothetical protein
MDRAESERHAVEHERLKRIYGAAVDRLFSIGYLATEEEYAKLKASVDDARFALELFHGKLKKRA